mmetsp:Transcript_7367/g.12435  ORF Transcript_7367/g.12435 Transcript_7367/m.12435 type:complete len:265 (-) Transcript_7367:588-1382(-)
MCSRIASIQTSHSLSFFSSKITISRALSTSSSCSVLPVLAAKGINSIMFFFAHTSTPFRAISRWVMEKGGLRDVLSMYDNRPASKLKKRLWPCSVLSRWLKLSRRVSMKPFFCGGASLASTSVTEASATVVGVATSTASVLRLSVTGLASCSNTSGLINLITFGLRLPDVPVVDLVEVEASLLTGLIGGCGALSSAATPVGVVAVEEEGTSSTCTALVGGTVSKGTGGRSAAQFSLLVLAATEDGDVWLAASLFTGVTGFDFAP